MNFAGYAFDINSRTLLQIEYKKPVSQSDCPTVCQSVSLAVWQSLSVSVRHSAVVVAI